MPVEFEWDERKRQANVVKHGIDFIDAKEIWQDEVRSPVESFAEERWIGYGLIGHRIVAVVFVRKNGTHRLISARRARDDERKAYQNAFGRGT